MLEIITYILITAIGFFIGTVFMGILASIGRSNEFEDGYKIGESKGFYEGFQQARNIYSFSEDRVSEPVVTAIRILIHMNNEALKNDYIKKPLCWALYNTWREIDKLTRDEKEDSE